MPLVRYKIPMNKKKYFEKLPSEETSVFYETFQECKGSFSLFSTFLLYRHPTYIFKSFIYIRACKKCSILRYNNI